MLQNQMNSKNFCIFFFSSGIKLFSLVVLHLDLLFLPNLFLLDLIIAE